MQIYIKQADRLPERPKPNGRKLVLYIVEQNIDLNNFLLVNVDKSPCRPSCTV